MTASIAWNKWGPLLVDGRVGTSSGCCCPKPCTCFINICPYIVTLTSPSQFITGTDTIACGEFNPVGRLRTWAPVPGGLLPCSEGKQNAQDRATVEVTNYEGNWGHHLSGSLEYLLNYTDVENSRQVSVQSSVRFDIRGVCHETYAEVTFQLTANALVGNQYDSYSLEKRGLYRVETACKPSGSLACVPLSDFDILHIVSPWTIEISQDTTSLGPYTQTTETASPGYADAGNDGVRQAVECVAEAISATFQITMRPTCQTFECSCGYSLDGIAMSLKGERFVVGNEPNPVRTSRAQQVWTFTDGANPSITYEVWDEFFLFIQQRIVAELFCSSEEQDSNLPNPQEVPTWYMFATADCFEWEAGIVVATTRETIIGRYDCYEHCEKFLPHGSPRPVVSVSVETPEGYGGGCSPPQNAIVIIDFEACE